MEIMAAIDGYDRKTAVALKSLSKTPGLITGMRIATVAASGFFCFPIYAAFLLMSNQNAHLIQIIIAAECIQLAVIVALKKLTQRPRPTVAQKGLFYPEWNTYSFPSLHASRAFMLAAIIGSFYNDWVCPAALAAALLIAFSRMVLLKHYLSDVICGGVIGFLISAILMAIL